jgi:hypothetical protein
MSSPNLVVSPTILQVPVIDPKSGRATPIFTKWLIAVAKSQKTVVLSFDQSGNLQAPVGAQATLAVRGIALTTLLDHLTNVGLLDTTDSIAVDGTGHPLAGGKAAYSALVVSAPTSGQVLGWNGANWVPVTLAAGGVTQIIAGTNVSISPSGGTGAVTINAAGGSSGTPTATVGPAAGTVGAETPSATLAAGSTDSRGQIQIVTGTGPTTGILATINLSAAVGSFVLISPANGAAIAAGGVASQVSAQMVTSSEWTLTADPNATQADVNFMAWNYWVIA